MDVSRNALEAVRADPVASVTLRAPGRLHLGFLDPAGSLGRRFGSLGLMINGFDTEVDLGASGSGQVSASGPAERAEIERAAACLHRLQRKSGRNEPLHLRLLRVAPAHAGFGSGTQLALAIGRAFAQWHGLDVPTATLALPCRELFARGQKAVQVFGPFDEVQAEIAALHHSFWHAR